jgi:hypothetical protein
MAGWCALSAITFVRVSRRALAEDQAGDLISSAALCERRLATATPEISWRRTNLPTF